MGGGGSGSSHNAGTIPVLSIPFEEKAASSKVTVKRHIELVEAFEQAFPEHERNNFPLMATRLRKIYYGLDGWDENLIVAATKIPRPFKTDQVEVSRFSLSLPDVPDWVDVVRKCYTIQDNGITHKVSGARCSCGATRIYHAQEVQLADGKDCDLGHVYAGLDAINNPNAVTLRIAGLPVDDFPIRICRNCDATTWVGDLGSVLAEWFFKQFHPDRGSSSPLSIKEANAVIHELAPGCDMLGNIDAFVIFDSYLKVCRPVGPKVSEVLRQYYLQNNEYRSHRYSIFAKTIGLQWDRSKKDFSNTDAWMNYYEDEIKNAAAMYTWVNIEGGFFGLSEAIGITIGISQAPSVRVISTNFLRELRNRIKSEK
jgi:hypothetical protein